MTRRGAEPPAARRRSPGLAAGLSAVPGLGQAYNGQWGKAAFFLAATVGTIGPAILLITTGEALGRRLLDAGQQGAFLLLAFGSILVFLAVLLLGLALWASAVVDARRSARELSEGRASTGRWWFFRL